MIEFKDASFHYAGEHGTGEGVDNVNLTVQTGELVVLCGRSGCGKTTLTRMVNGLAPHFYEGLMEGCVLIDGFNVSEAELADVSKRVGSVFQNPKSQFFNVDTTGEVAFGCENLCMPRERIRERVASTVADLDIGALMDRSIFELSGGEKQQVACASVYAAQPSVLVMDEPSSNLDKKAISRLHDVMAGWKADGRTLIVSEHRLYYLMDLADRFIYLDDGRVARQWTASEMRALPDSELAALGLRCTDLSQVSLRAGRQSDHAKEPRAARPAIEGIDISCNRGNVQILDVDSLSLPAGAVVALIGDNGSGKSTLAETLCGLEKGSSGPIALDGEYLSDKARSRESFMVMQDVNLQLFCDSVIDEVMFNAPVTREQAASTLERLGLAGTEERHPASLSGGQKQRVAIASALCAGKRFLFYDEPTSGLDRDGMERFGDLLNDVAGAARLSVVITHDLELVLHCCTHVLQVENGRAQGLYLLDDEGIARARAYFLSKSDRSTSRRRKNQGHFARILSYTGKWRRWTYASIAVMVVAVAAKLVPYLLVFHLLSMLLGGEGISLEHGAIVFGCILAAELGYAVLYPLGLTLSHVAAYHTLENIRTSIQERLDAQPVGAVRALGTGAVKKLLSDDVESLEVTLAHMIPEGLANLIVPIASLLVMMAVDWELALLACVVIALGVAATKQMYKTGINNMGTYYASMKRLNNAIIEYVDGMEVVKVFNRDGEAGARLSKMINGYRDYALGWYKVCWPWMAAYSSIFGNVALYSLPIGALLVVTGQLALPSYVLVLCLSFGLGPMLLHGIGFVAALPQANYKIQSLEKAADREPLAVGEETLSDGADDGGGAGGDGDGTGARGAAGVELRDVRFSYGEGEALRGVSLECRLGEVLAIVGESGSGKSTAARLIAHHYDVGAGRVLICGKDVRALSPDAAADAVAYVSQDVFLFDDTIAGNIRAGRPEASDTEVEQAARAAQCSAFVGELPLGFDTSVGGGGAKLSGGERQRVTFARALLKRSPVLVLDEATAYLDAETERRVMAEAFAAAHERDCAVVVVAHRLRTVAGADSIVVMHEGRVEAQGSHDELLAASERYRRLWDASERGAAWTVTGQGAVVGGGRSDADAAGAADGGSRHADAAKAGAPC